LLAAHDEGWADPDRLYTEARRARLLLDAARASVASAIGCRPDELRFVGSSTAARQDGMLGLLAARSAAGSTAVASAVEHSAILQAVPQTVRTPVDRVGRVDPEGWGAAVTADGVALAALQAANHEVGTTQPVTAAADACGEVPLLVDATAWLPWRPAPAGWSVLVGGAEAWGGPPGVGLLAVRKGVRWRSPHPEPTPPEASLPAVLAAATALEAVRATADEEASRLSALVDLVREQVPLRIPDVEVVGDPVERLPHVVTFSCLYVDGEPLLSALDAAGFAVGSGSACTSSALEPSHVLAAMGALTHGNIRLSLHPGVTEADVRRFLEVLPEAVAGVRRSAGVEGL
ncbi:MAG: cysteine desulfurase, partial [Frankiales bacterium]|nr:cysteine desulfurase [Frankiales bacterium]